MRKELRRMVVTRSLVVKDSDPSPSTAPIPSVSSSSNANSSHSRAVVDSQIPRVHASIECPSLNAGSPTTREMKKDFPERQGPQMASTATGFLMVFSSSSASGTSCSSVPMTLVAIEDASPFATSPVALFH